jgi:hypothetical protein
MEDMSTQTADLDREIDEIVRLVSATSKDPAALQLARQRADAIRQEMRVKYGDRNIAVELVHEARDGQ